MSRKKLSCVLINLYPGSFQPLTNGGKELVIVTVRNRRFPFNINHQFLIQYLSVEHPQVTYYNPKYLNYANLTTIRYGRANPIYYVGLNLDLHVTFDSSIYIDVYFYELLTGQYKRSFIEMHFNWCHLVEKDMFFGAAMRKAGLTKPCPHPPDIIVKCGILRAKPAPGCVRIEQPQPYRTNYQKALFDSCGPINLQNMTVNPNAIPNGFPFTRGRIIANFTHPKTKTRFCIRRRGTVGADRLQGTFVFSEPESVLRLNRADIVDAQNDVLVFFLVCSAVQLIAVYHFTYITNKPSVHHCDALATVSYPVFPHISNSTNSRKLCPILLCYMFPVFRCSYAPSNNRLNL
ncbi:unnamed protein product [Chrysodeixis includens]|uniref:Uncharacterized protein n=1 Tax=Chrysodeixis includens TaxID=689277 RepID=A0A9N8L3N0_CHRIL|nr:unnamed protein product [Chrysodeixis includens]